MLVDISMHRIVFLKGNTALKMLGFFVAFFFFFFTIIIIIDQLSHYISYIRETILVALKRAGGKKKTTMLIIAVPSGCYCKISSRLRGAEHCADTPRHYVMIT